MLQDESKGAAAGAAAAGGAPGGAAFRLDKGTHLHRVGFRGYFVDYGEGLAEVGFGFASAARRCKTRRGESLNRGDNELRALRRARTRLRHLVLGSGATYLLTLTYRENVTDLERASDDLTVFLRHVKRKYPSYTYIAVAERQKRGAWHWHLAVCGWQDLAFLRASWLRVVGEGNIDVKPPRYGSENLRLGLVRYLSKYLSKSMGDDHVLNSRRFRSSHRIHVPERRYFIPARSFAEAREYCERWLVKVGQQVGFFISCEQTWSGWGCTW